MDIGTPATSLISQGIKNYDASRFSSSNNGHYYTWHSLDSDLSPSIRSTEFDNISKNLLSNINSIYGSLEQGKGIDYQSRMSVDIIGSILTGKELSEFSKNRNSYLPMLTGTPNIEDKSILQAWYDNFNSYWLSSKIAKKMNIFDTTEDEDEKAHLLEDIGKLNSELVKYGDYKNRNIIVNGLIQSGKITAQAVEALAWTIGTAGVAGAVSGATAAASTGSSLLQGLTKSYLLSKTSKGARLAGTVVNGLINTYAVERGNLSYELYNITDEDGRRMPDSIRKTAATVGAMVSTAIEYITPGPDVFVDKIIKGKVGKTIVSNSVSEAASKFVKDAFFGALGESFEEALQTISSSTVSDIARYVSDKTSNTKYNVDFWASFENNLNKSVKTFSDTLLPSFFSGAGGNAYNAMRSINVNAINGKDKNAVKNAKKNQEFAETDSNVTIINSDNLSGTGLKPTKDYTVSTDTEGKETKVKLDTIKVVRDPESLTDFIPATDEEADKVQFLKSKGQSHIAVEVIDDDSAFTEMSSESLGNLVAMNNGTIENNNPTFSTKEDFDAFKESMNKLHVMTNEKGEYLVTDGNGNNMAINPVLTSQQDAQIIRETEKEVGKPFVEQVRQAYKDAGANVSDREIALASKLAGMLGNANKVTVLSENDSSVTEEERKALAGSRGITHFTEDTAKSIRIILSKDADATTIVHEMFHVALRTNKEARTRLISSFKQTLANDKTRAELKKFYEDHMEILQDNDLKTAEDVLTVLDLLEEDNVFTDSIFEEVLTKTFEAFDADNNIRADKRMPIALKKFFEELSTLFKSIYKSITGKDLAKLPSKVESSYKSFLNTKSSEILRQPLFEYLSDEYGFDVFEESSDDSTKIEDIKESEIFTPPVVKDEHDLKAPNGKPSNLPSKQWHMVRTENFKKWFGDWENDPENASVVVDENGEPLIMYHGTRADFDVFDTTEEGSQRKRYESAWNADYPEGTMFAISDPESARYYGHNVMPLFVSLRGANVKEAKSFKDAVTEMDDKGMSSEDSFVKVVENGKVGGIVCFSHPEDVKSATMNTGEFSSENPSILHQDILDTTLLDEGATRKHWSDVSENDAVAFVNSDVLIPDSVLQKYSERFEIRQEIELRKKLLTIANAAQKMSAARSMSIGEFFDSLKGEYGEAFEQTHMKELFRKFYIYANTQTPKQMEQSFVNEYSTVQKLIELKNIISPRMVARRQNGKVVRSLFVPQTGYAYNSLKNITENSSAEEIKEALNKIKKNPSVFLKAMLRSKADYQKFRALNNDSDAYVKTVGQIYYLSTSKADLAFLENLRKISNDSLDSEDRDIAEQIKEFNKEKIEFGKNSIDETFVEAEGKFMQDELDAMSELMKTNVHNARIEERDRAYKKEQKVKGDYQNKLDKANEKVKSVREAERDAKREAVELERLKGQIKAYDIEQSYGKKIEDLKMMKNLEIEQLRYIKNKKIENISEEWKRKNKEVIEKYKKWKDDAIKNVEKEYDIRINNLKLKIKEKELKEKTDRQIKRKLSFDSSRHDAFAIRSIKYVHSLIYNLAEGMDADEVASYSTRTGKDGEEDLIVTYYQEDADGNEIESQTAMNIGLDNIYHGDIPNELVSYLSDNVIAKLNRPDFRWYMLSSSERKNILEALVSVKKDAETSLNYKKAHKQYRRSEMWSKAAASILKRDELLTDKDIDALSKELGIPKDDPDFMRKARKKFVEEIDKFEKAPTLTWKNKVAGVIASTFGHIGPVARFLDGGKEGAIYDLFVNRPQKALDAFASAVQKRNEEARLVFDEILNSGELSRENKFAELAKKVEIETNNINGEKQELTGWNIMGAYMYAQNVHGFVKLIAPNGGNNISLEQMARINPKATLEIINEALLEMREHKEQEVRRYEYNQKRGTEYKPNEYSGLLKRYDEIVLENLRDRIESNMIQPMLPDWAMALGDSMIDLLSKYTNDVGKAAYDLYNMPFTKQKRYFPLVGYVNSKDASLAELMTAQRTVSHGFIQERTKKENYALLLDPMAIFFSAIEAQERMIHLTEVVKDMNYALQPYGGNLKKIVADRFGTDMAGYLDSQLRTLAGEHYHLSRYEKIANAFLQKASLSKLGFNVVSTGKQFISAIPAIADGEISVVDFIGAIALNNSNKDAVIATYNRLAPDIAQSSVEYDIRQMKKANQTTKAGTKIAKLEETAMKLTETADQYIKRIVWTASFEKHMKAGLSEEDSALKASALVKRTQSISGAYDLSEIQRSKNPWVRAFFMFTNDLFQTWNTLTLGIASDIKSKDYARAFEKAIGFALTSSALALAAFGWLPEEDEEEGLFDSDSFFKDLAKSLVSGTPLVGTALEDAVSGFKSTLIGLPEELVSIATMPIHHEERGYTWADYADQLYDTLLEALSLTGAPTVSIDRTLKMTAFPGGFAEGPNFSLDNLAYGLGSRAGESLPNFLREIADELN